MPDWVRDKLLIPLVVGAGAFVLGLFGDDIKARLFPPSQTVQVGGVTYQRGVRLGDYLKVTGNDTSRFAPEQLRTRGIVVFADVATTGYKGHQLHLSGTVVNAASEIAVRMPEPAMWGRFFTPPADTSQQSPDAWFAEPCSRGSYLVLVRVERSTSNGWTNLRHDSGPRFKVTKRHCDRQGI